MKAHSQSSLSLFLACVVFGLCASNARAFSLLGPFEPWMEETNGLRQPGDIGGPMDITNEYRWNVPVVTYGFDKSFLDFFGSNGVAAVESAIQILNDLPPASLMDPTIYPLDSTAVNYHAQAEKLVDLKSETLCLLLQQLGLAPPDPSTFCLRSFTFTNGVIVGNVIMRNYDPVTYLASSNVDGTLLGYYLFNYSPIQGYWDAAEYPLDPNSQVDLAVADGNTEAGFFFTSLTRDDVGGLRYLLQTNNYNFETLLPDVHGAGTNADNYANLALRGGVDKITFVRVALDSLTGEFFSPVTNQWTDTYVTNGVLRQQQLERTTIRPDLLFSAANLGNSNQLSVAVASCTGTTNWIINATLNGNPDGAGPGMIQPPVKIVFNKAGRQFVTAGGSISSEAAYDYSWFYGSFDGSTNAPIVYPIVPPGSGQLSVRMWLTMGQPSNSISHSFDWETNTAPGTAFAMETSTNLTDWMTLFTVTNDGRGCTYFVQNPASPARFYRLVPQ